VTGQAVPGPVPDSRAGLLEKLLAAVRPEFREDMLVFDPADPVFGGTLCAVDECERTARYGACVTDIISGGLPQGAPNSIPSLMTGHGTATARCCHAGCPAAASAWWAAGSAPDVSGDGTDEEDG
jgi:hypothetical protein